MTRHCQARTLNVAKLRKVATEAAEQCRRLTVPPVEEPAPLSAALAAWADERPSRPLLLCDERGGGPPLARLVAADATASELTDAGVLIGPEGGFSPEEFAELDELDFVRRVSLGVNTLRAETAAMAACAVLACR